MWDLYLIVSIFLSAWGISFFVLSILASFRLLVGGFLEGLAIPVFGLYFLLQIPLFILNVIVLVLIFVQRIEKLALAIPATFFVNNLIILLSSVGDFTKPYRAFLQQILTSYYVSSVMIIVLAINLWISIKFIREE